MDRDDTLGEYVRRLRRRKHWGLQDLANSASLSVSHLSRIENDGVVPNPETVVKLATALNGELDRMLEMADCLPREIFERYIRRAGDGGRAVAALGRVGSSRIPHSRRRWSRRWIQTAARRWLANSGCPSKMSTDCSVCCRVLPP